MPNKRMIFTVIDLVLNFFRVEGQAEIEDGYLHVVFDLNEVLGRKIM